MAPNTSEHPTDARRFDQLVLAQVESIRRIGLSTLRDRERVADFVQEVILRAYVHRDQLRDPERVPQWLAVIAKNTARTWNRRRDTLPVDEILNVPAGGPSPDDQLVDEERWSALSRALEGINDEDATLIRLRYMEEQSYDLLQQFFGVSYAALRKRLSRARHLLRQQFRGSTNFARARRSLEVVMPSAIVRTDCPNLELTRRGKVRDIYGVGDHLLLVATDRISAFDVVLPNGIANKGKALTALSAFWFDYTRDLVPNHLVSTDVNEFPSVAAEYADTLVGRTMYVLRTERVDIECVVRGYLSGSAWREYRESGTVCGERMPDGLVESDKLPEPIFTPATKADTGHDENISMSRMAQIVGQELTDHLSRTSIAMYEAAAGYAAERGIIIADTKFEFGERDGEIILIDEALTADSSRFWPADDYEPGRAQRSFDKQYVRDYLETLDWGKTYPGPELPPEAVDGTSARYQEAYEQIVGRPLVA